MSLVENAMEVTDITAGSNGRSSLEETPSETKVANQRNAQPDKYGFFPSQRANTDVRNLESAVPSEILRRREMKWREMLENWELWMKKRFKKVRERCRKGVPSSLRARAWPFLCGGDALQKRYKGMFEELDSQIGDPQYVDDIRKDLDRQFPQHEIFVRNLGQQELFRVLKAYSIFRPAVGYCQAQAPIAAILLMHMPSEAAFYCFVEICDNYLKGYYNPGLETVQLDGLILFGLLKKFSPQSYSHLTKLDIGPMLVMTEWFLCAFTRTLPWPCVLRVFDMFLCEGIRVLFKVAIVLIDSMLGSAHITKSELKKKCPTNFDTLEYLKHAGENLQEEAFVQQVVDLELKRSDLVREHERQLEKKKKAAAAAQKAERQTRRLRGRT